MDQNFNNMNVVETNTNAGGEKLPNYVLKFNDRDLKKVNDKNNKIKTAVLIIVAILIVGSFIFQDNLFAELSWTARVLLVCLAMGVMFTGKNEEVPCPTEIRFYDDYLIVYHERKYFSKKVIRKMYDKFYYKDIHQIQFRRRTQRINIYGVVEGIWYNYNADGSLPQNPTYHRTVDAISYFYTRMNPEIDYVKEIESHSPVKVTVEDN